MNNKPSTKVRRRQNYNYKVGHPNLAKGKPRKHSGITMSDRHGQAHPKLGLFYDLQSGKVRA